MGRLRQAELREVTAQWSTRFDMYKTNELGDQREGEKPGPCPVPHYSAVFLWVIGYHTVCKPFRIKKCWWVVDHSMEVQGSSRLENATVGTSINSMVASD